MKSYTVKGDGFNFSTKDLVETLITFLQGGSKIKAIVTGGGESLPLVQNHLDTLTYLEGNQLIEISVNVVVERGLITKVKRFNADEKICVIYYQGDTFLTAIKPKDFPYTPHPLIAILRRDWQVGDLIEHPRLGLGNVIETSGYPFKKSAIIVFKREFPQGYDFMNLPPVNHTMKRHQDLLNTLSDDLCVFDWSGKNSWLEGEIYLHTPTHKLLKPTSGSNTQESRESGLNPTI
jgi:hypothetical protein